MANKRVIDLAELSQTVQEGQYILADSAGGTGKMNLKRILDDNKTEIDDTLSISGYAADAKAVGDALDAVNGTLATKADVDGTYTDMAVGDVVSDKSVTDTTPYLFRPSASVGERAYETIVGASVGWNQPCPDSEAHVQSSTALSWNTFNLAFFSLISGHKYFVGLVGKTVSGGSIGLRDTTAGIIYRPTPMAYSFLYSATTNTNGTTFVQGNWDAGTTDAHLVWTDLTAELGSTIADYVYSLETATAGSGIAKLREWGFLRGYQAFNAGSIESVKVTGKKVVGFNQWDEEWEVGGINSVTGEPLEANNRIRSKNYSPCFPNTNYYCWIGSSGVSVYAWFYDADKNFISGAGVGNRITTFPNNARYFKLSTYGGNYSTYKHDICINLSSSRNGEYEPYRSQSYPLGSDTLRGIFKLDANNNLYADGDVKSADGMITRKYGIRAYQSGDESLADAFTNGIQTVYKLTTPTTETSTPFTSPQTVYPDGTEEFITENGVPVGHSTNYPYSIKALAEELIGIPDVPSANGTYVLKATRSASGVSYAWVTG